MSEFFDSEIIQEELKEINELQREIYQNAASYGVLSREDKLEHIDMLSDLLEKQRVMYTRMSLSNDPKAVEMKNELMKSVQIMGFPDGTDISILFNGMNQTIQKLRQHIDLL
tara:strand:- start:511 stop:846 length:336 start_codon:yes stop_codon:yes gene_type:complete